MKAGREISTPLAPLARFAPVLIFGAALAARLAHFFWRGVGPGGDTDDYLKIAANLALNGAFSIKDAPPFDPTLRRPPLYPFFLSFWQTVAGAELVPATVAAFQCALDAATAALVFYLAARVVGPRLAAAAGLFYAVHPGAIMYTNVIMTETLFTFLLAATVLLVVAGLEKHDRNHLLAAGFALALAVLCRPVAVVFAPLLLGFVLARSGAPRKYRDAALAAAVFALALAPWLVRCYEVAGRFVFVHGISAFQFYMPTRFDLDQRDEQRLLAAVVDPDTGDEYFRLLARAETADEYGAAERVGYRRALENISRGPGAYLASRARAFPHLLLTSFDRLTGYNVSFSGALAGGQFFAFALKAALLLVFSLLPLALSLIGLAAGARRPAAALGALVWTAYLALHAAMWIEYRFWVPMIPLQLVSAAAGAAWLARRAGARGGRALRRISPRAVRDDTL